LSGAAACSAPGGGGPGLRPGAPAAVAGSKGVHRDVPADPERGLLECEQDAGPEVLPPSGSAPRGWLAAPPERPGAEERFEDLADVAEGEGLGPTPSVQVVPLSLVRVRKDLVCRLLLEKKKSRLPHSANALFVSSLREPVA